MTPLVLDVAALLESGQVVVENRQALRHALLDRLDDGLRHFVLDCSRVGYIDASGLGVLVQVEKVIHRDGGSLVLVGLNDDLLTLFELTKLDTLFTLYPSLADVPGLGPALVPSLPAPREGVTHA